MKNKIIYLVIGLLFIFTLCITFVFGKQQNKNNLNPSQEILQLSGMIEENARIRIELENKQTELKQSNDMLRIKKAGLENYINPKVVFTQLQPRRV